LPNVDCTHDVVVLFADRAAVMVVVSPTVREAPGTGPFLLAPGIHDSQVVPI